jgi:hypothetical protein
MHKKRQSDDKDMLIKLMMVITIGFVGREKCWLLFFDSQGCFQMATSSWVNMVREVPDQPERHWDMRLMKHLIFVNRFW